MAILDGNDQREKEDVRTGTVSEGSEASDEPQYPPMTKIVFIMMALYTSVFLVFLDRLIVATAVPSITDEFKSLGDIGWYGSAYLLTASASQLIYGRLYTFYPAKVVYLASIVIFEVGSAACGAAPSSNALIISRAVAGLGTGGITSGLIIMIVFIVPPHLRAMFQSLAGVTFGVSSVLGPILGGIFTTELTWRWCFYINLPFGGVSIIAIFFLLDVPPPKGNWPLKKVIAHLDPVGNLFLIPGVVSILLALQWGGSKYDWSNWRIIFLFIMSGVLAILFILAEIRGQEKALVPPRIFKQRSVMAGVVWTMCTISGMLTMLYYIPIWFQAIKNVDAEKSGIMNIPMVVSMVISAVGSGVLVSVMGYYTPFMYAATIITSVGAGLLTTWKPDTGHAMWIGYQVIFGFGAGLGMMQANVAVQTCLAPSDVPVGASLMVFSQQLNGAIFLAVADSLFGNFLKHNMRSIPGLPIESVVGSGATSLSAHVPADKLDAVLAGYSNAITKVFILGVAMSCLSIFPALAMEWKDVRKPPPKDSDVKT